MQTQINGKPNHDRWNKIHSKESDNRQGMILHNDKKWIYQDSIEPLHCPVPNRTSLSIAHEMENTKM